MRRIAVAPADRFRRSVVAVNVGANATCEVGDGREDAAREYVAFDLCKPQLDLVQPRGIGRREMQPHFRMLDGRLNSNIISSPHLVALF